MTAPTVYTDVEFAARRARHFRYTALVSLAIITINGLGWGLIGLRLGATAMSAIDFSFAAIGLVGLAAARWLSLRTITHITVAAAFLFVWVFILTIEGVPGERAPVMNHWWFVAISAGAALLYYDAPLARIASVLACIASFVACELPLFDVPPRYPLPEMPQSFMTGMAAGVHVSSFLGVLAVIAVFVASITSAERQLHLANERLEALLSNMLPASISARLRREGRTFADGFAECSVLFADLAGFTKLTEEMPPERLVALLDEIFSRFDELTEALRLEKIKTIGDAYMVAAGLPEPRADHAQACVALAVNIRAVVREYAGLHVRIGISSGSVVAGVIGKRKFIYDLWGDTVNLASRMESHGVVDEIQVSARTAELIAGEYETRLRGAVEMKGKGSVTAFLVVGRKISVDASSLSSRADA